MTQTLGNLSQVPLRTIWPHEAADFTPWLASEESVFAGMKRSVNAPKGLATQHFKTSPEPSVQIQPRGSRAQFLLEDGLPTNDRIYIGALGEHLQD